MEVTDFNKEPETQIVIRFQDCDPFGHLNNARYIDYFVNARSTSWNCLTELLLKGLIQIALIHGSGRSGMKIKESLQNNLI